MDDLLQEFLTETAENLEVIDTELVRFEADPSDRATLNNIFRLVHTIKGTCGFLGLPRLEAVAHAGETLLGKFRDGVLPVTPDSVTLVLRAIDRIKDILVGLETTGAEQQGDDSAIIDAMHAVAEGKAVPTPAPVETVKVGPNGERWDPDMQRFLRPGEVSLADLEAAFRGTEGPDIQDAVAPPPPPAAQAPALAASSKPAAKSIDVEVADDDPGPRGEVTGAQTIRVNVDVLEQLMTMVSELVLTRNQLMQMVRGLGDSEFKVPLQRLSNITAELQDRVMKTRMQPVGSAWRKLPRIVRDICRETGKKIDLRMEGEATELDRQVLELIKDPLTHMIRNSADHGIEAPAARLAKGKLDVGVIRLNAHHEGGHIIIEVADDGAGLNTARIREKAIDKGLVGASEALAMSEAQIHRFIFAPGFSTAAAVTNLSGRGVGMDVVKTNIEVIGGSIELASTEGGGTTFKIKIPLTLAIVSALILGANGQRFAAPQTSVLELVRVGVGAEHIIEQLNATPVLRLRERLLPLVDLADALNLGAQTRSEESPRYVVVMQVGAARFGVIVDEVHDTEEIVVKPLATLLRGGAMLSGATILGDGSVVVILDPNGLSGAVGRHHDKAESGADVIAAGDVTSEDGQSLILFRAGSETLKAVPLKLVTRLEEVDVASIERADGRAVFQYRGALTPVVHAAGDFAYKNEGKQPILIFTRDQRAFGVAVDEIVDIVHERLVLDLATDRAGVVGAAIMRGRATELVDIGYFLSMLGSEWTDRRGAGVAAKGRVLLVDRSDFTLNLLGPLLRAAGYATSEAKTFDQAWRLNEAGEHFDVILADIDSDPRGAEAFAEKAASDARWSETERLALTERRTGQIANFSDHVGKMDRAGLLAALDYVLRRKGDAA
jgi:two-component system, chemotaxis family, sensor kinase CheA